MPKKKIPVEYGEDGYIKCYSPHGCLYGGDCYKYGCAYHPLVNPDTKYQAEEDFFNLEQIGAEIDKHSNN
jgi:hypothetical protein